MTRFSAHVQYDDWKGTAAADDADTGSIRKFLRDNGALGDHEFLIGFEIYSGQDYFAARAFIIEAGDYEGAVRDVTQSEPVETIVREMSLTVDQFLALFKRFNVVLTHKGLDLEGKDYREREV